MKQKLLFTIQVFSVLVLFLSIFVVSLEREEYHPAPSSGNSAAVMSQEDENEAGSSLFVPFTHVLPALFGF